jgi:tripartite-type tricarboxylate transporter receptor subunit TctC
LNQKYLIKKIFLLCLSVLSYTSYYAIAAFPEKSITLIVPTAPGGPIDLTARVISKQLAVELGQPIIVINRPGASQKIGVDSLISSPKDGYTIAAVSPASMTINPVLDKNISYDPVNDLTHLINAIEYQSVLVSKTSIPVKNLADFVAYARKNPGKLSYGSGGGGTSMHFTTSAFLNLAKIDALHVPYKSSGPAMLGLLGNEVDFLMPDLGDIKSYINGGQVVALAISGKTRSKVLPNVPTFSESNIPELKNWNYTGWIGIVAPAGIPLEVSNKLQNALQATMNSDPVRESFDNIGFKVVATPGEQFKKLIQDELILNRKIAKEGNITK